MWKMFKTTPATTTVTTTTTTLPPPTIPKVWKTLTTVATTPFKAFDYRNFHSFQHNIANGTNQLKPRTLPQPFTLLFVLFSCRWYEAWYKRQRILRWYVQTSLECKLDEYVKHDCKRGWSHELWESQHYGDYRTRFRTIFVPVHHRIFAHWSCCYLRHVETHWKESAVNVSIQPQTWIFELFVPTDTSPRRI